MTVVCKTQAHAQYLLSVWGFHIINYSSKWLITVNTVLTICKGSKYLDEHLPSTAKHANRKQVSSAPFRFKSNCCIISNITMNSLLVYLNLRITLLKAFIGELRLNPVIWLGDFFSNMLWLCSFTYTAGPNLPLKQFLWYTWVPHYPKTLKFQILGRLTP